MLKDTPPSSSLNSSVAPASCPLSQPYRNLNVPSLLYEACGRTVNPVNGAIGMLWTGNWNICQAAVETVLRGGSLRPIPELLTHGGGFAGFPSATSEEASEICTEMLNLQQNNSSDRNVYHHSRFSSSRSRSTMDSSPTKRKRLASEQQLSSELDLSLIPNFPIKTTPSSTRRRVESPSMNSEESVTTTTTTSFWDNTATATDDLYGKGGETSKLLNLFV
ncbi:hypothetical protein EUTSA_v10004811mg [Eutrema salsugineum]|uniref:LOB domain-containing protein n=1 Tax=Eutrema salsugineum TaxID=72664 RepID=V4K073_EUTSA|nr:hypothetical protein EUTSA_v10004811mg [Eutrema salsugineum]